MEAGKSFNDRAGSLIYLTRVKFPFVSILMLFKFISLAEVRVIAPDPLVSTL